MRRCRSQNLPVPDAGHGGRRRSGASLKISGSDSEMDALPRNAEHAEVDGVRFGVAEPVWDVGVEFDCLTGVEHEVAIAQHDAEAAVEHVEPVVALVGARLRFDTDWPGCQDVLERLDVPVLHFAAARIRYRSVSRGGWRDGEQ